MNSVLGLSVSHVELLFPLTFDLNFLKDHTVER